MMCADGGLGASEVLAQDIKHDMHIETGMTAWILASSALVMAKTIPGLAVLQGSLVSMKKVVGTLMHGAVLFW